jgi:hypothetical protein
MASRYRVDHLGKQIGARSAFGGVFFKAMIQAGGDESIEKLSDYLLEPVAVEDGVFDWDSEECRLEVLRRLNINVVSAISNQIPDIIHQPVTAGALKRVLPKELRL